jgi:hypothetical protein
MNLIEEAGSEDRKCRPVNGKAKSCNGSYGRNGWLGLATIRVNGSHITSGTAKMNDTYLLSGAYSDTAKQHVMCQEIGHDFGLGHQDESGADLNTCMDYSSALDNPHPNQPTTSSSRPSTARTSTAPRRSRPAWRPTRGRSR